ncbi:MAG: hypothetical protein HY545_02260 [Candidatus Doudnabacteria bacterium]|nr:hypothetical protein [Candidatus Doudnabacteria bacterium]
MSDYKIILGFVAIAFGLGSYAPYFWYIYKGKVKPHAFTWFVWGTATGIGFAAITVAGGGPGAWEMAVNSVLCFTVAGIGLYQRHVKYVVFDWLALIGALLGLFLWWLTNNPLAAIILLSISDAVGFLPTYRKVYLYPHEEKPGPWIMGIIKYVIVLFALDSFTVTTWLYPATILLVDITFTTLMIIRQKQMRKRIL